jgi:hypothetical protein
MLRVIGGTLGLWGIVHYALPWIYQGIDQARTIPLLAPLFAHGHI